MTLIHSTEPKPWHKVLAEEGTWQLIADTLSENDPALAHSCPEAPPDDTWYFHPGKYVNHRNGCGMCGSRIPGSLEAMYHIARMIHPNDLI